MALKLARRSRPAPVHFILAYPAGAGAYMSKYTDVEFLNAPSLLSLRAKTEDELHTWTS